MAVIPQSSTYVELNISGRGRVFVILQPPRRFAVRADQPTHQNKSTEVTTNKSFGQWHEVFPNASCVVSLIDRLVHRCEVVAIEGKSYRLKEAKERAAQKAATRAKAGRKATKK